MAKQTKQKRQEREYIGTCSLCNEPVRKKDVEEHLTTCPKSAKGGKPGKTKVFHLLVEASGAPVYWLFLQAPERLTLGNLDQFLRTTWLECCGHMSAFEIAGVRYSCTQMDMYNDEKTMKSGLKAVLAPGMTFYHEYDFGTPTHLTLHVLDAREIEIALNSIRLLARNRPLEIACELCGAPATEICSQCIYDGEGTLCPKCAAKHECGEEMLLPVVNSPRMGVCGYTGQ